MLNADNYSETLVMFTAKPGSEDAQRLALLAIIGTQSMPMPGTDPKPRDQQR